MSSSALADIEVDVEALAKKYADERAKRIRTDASNQYAELKGKFADFAKDPHADPSFKRDPIVEDCDVLIIGGGLAGMRAAQQIDPSLRTMILTKDKVEESNSSYAQGGVGMLNTIEMNFGTNARGSSAFESTDTLT